MVCVAAPENENTSPSLNGRADGGAVGAVGAVGVDGADDADAGGDVTTVDGVGSVVDPPPPQAASAETVMTAAHAK